jgi:crotonobetainyl-CoA:carnitine CoA-transferase CaiB-like acyl-CoA transferase
VDVAMLDTAMLLMASLAVSTMATGNSPPPTGAEAFSRSPSSGTYDTTEGHLGLAANNEEQFARLCHALDLAHLLSDPRFAAGGPRKDNTDALRAEFSAKFATRSAAEWEDILDKARVPAVRVRKMHEVLGEGQLAARGLMQPTALPGLAREVAIPTLGFKANGGVMAAQSEPPTLGQHTAEVLGKLGLDVSKLRADGVV